MMNWINKKRNKKGFTLVELVVVIAILGILAAIAVPRFTDVTNRSKWSAHAANIKTIEAAIEMAIANGTALTAINVTADGTTTNTLTAYMPQWPVKPGTYVVANGVLTANPTKANTLIEVEKTGSLTPFAITTP